MMRTDRYAASSQSLPALDPSQFYRRTCNGKHRLRSIPFDIAGRRHYATVVYDVKVLIASLAYVLLKGNQLSTD